MRIKFNFYILSSQVKYGDGKPVKWAYENRLLNYRRFKVELHISKMEILTAKIIINKKCKIPWRRATKNDIWGDYWPSDPRWSKPKGKGIYTIWHGLTRKLQNTRVCEISIQWKGDIIDWITINYLMEPFPM